MTVRAHKPEFNFREKLKELDYARLPYEKMPGGSVIQVATQRATDAITVSVNSWTVITGMILDFYPKYTDSKVWINVMSHYYVQSTNTAPNWTGANYKLHSSVHGDLISDPDYGNAHYVGDSAERYMGYRNFSFTHIPNTNELTYTVYGKCHTSNAGIQFHRSDYGMQGLITVMEIRQ